MENNSMTVAEYKAELKWLKSYLEELRMEDEKYRTCDYYCKGCKHDCPEAE